LKREEILLTDGRDEKGREKTPWVEKHDFHLESSRKVTPNRTIRKSARGRVETPPSLKGKREEGLLQKGKRKEGISLIPLDQVQRVLDAVKNRGGNAKHIQEEKRLPHAREGGKTIA